MSLFVLASKDGWVNIMYTGLDAVGVDQQVSDSGLNQWYPPTGILKYQIIMTFWFQNVLTHELQNCFYFIFRHLSWNC